MERHFRRDIDELAVIVPFLSEAADVLELDSGAVFALNMVVEELFTNMVKYNGMGADDIMVGVERNGDWMTVHLVDFDSEPFDYTESKEVDISAPLHARKPGGLGIHLVKRFMDEVMYEYKDRKTTIRLGKKLTNHA
ncbi:MAG: ATP-binding protein [Bacteroidetes bacterium]|nr:ATP-binding protein [Bacteroidota bacterium]